MSFVRVEVEDFVTPRPPGAGRLAVVTMARPEKLNALSRGVIAELDAAFAALEKRFPEVRCAVLTGEGKAFVAGADIAEMKDMDEAQARAFSQAGHDLGVRMESLSFPILAAVNGFALGGGCELMLACDFAVASDKAKFGQPEVKLGVIPGFGGTQRLLRRVGVAKARELVYTGAMIDAEAAAAIGLVNEVVAPEQLMARAREVAGQIAQMGPLAVREAKRVILDGEGRLLRDANALEIAAFGRCFASKDQKEGMDAFLAKRAAAFTGS